MSCLLLLLCLLLVLPGQPWAADPPRLYVIPKGTQHLFWRVLRAGAEQAGRDLGAEITFRGPGEDDNRSGQELLIRRALDQGYDAIVLAPNHDSRYLPLAEEARRRGIPLVVIDSQMQGQAHRTLVATDNYAAGYAAGRRLQPLLAGGAKLLLVRYLKNNTSTERREQGVIDALAAAGLAVHRQGYVGASVGEAQRNTLRLLQAGPVDTIFASNESATEGVLRALKAQGLLGRVKVVGFDYSPALWAGLEAGDLEALVLQQPYEIGYVGVRAALAALRGEALPAMIPVDALVVDRHNLDDPTVQAVVDRNRLSP